MDKSEFINDLVEKKDRVIPVIGWKSFVTVNDGIEISLQKYIIDKMVIEDCLEKNIMPLIPQHYSLTLFISA